MKHSDKTFAMCLVVVLLDSFQGTMAREKLCGGLTVRRAAHQVFIGQGLSWRDAFNVRFFNSFCLILDFFWHH